MCLDTALWAFLTASSAAMMMSAGFWDVRIRRVPDWHWAVIAAIGIICSSFLAWGKAPDLSVLAYAASSSMLAAYMLSERVPGILALPAAFAVSAWAWAETGYAGLFGPGIAFAAFLCMYVSGLIRGGADAKALMSLSLAFPSYPDIGGLPLFWPPSWPAASFLCLPLSVLALAAILTSVPMLFIGARNAFQGRQGRGMFTEFPMPTSEARSSFVWTLQDVEDGAVVRTAPSDDPGAISRLEGAGVQTVTVTPMVPFVAFLAAGLLVAVLLGNPLFALFREKGPGCGRLPDHVRPGTMYAIGILYKKYWMYIPLRGITYNILI
ncbi:MAG: hypothetical protein J5674_00785 [Candidatus Methanomethylophilaceae archaeon]|nr:hypothetical protein [Candidatus Methanomethylophilaceae archaeon]